MSCFFFFCGLNHSLSLSLSLSGPPIQIISDYSRASEGGTDDKSAKQLQLEEEDEEDDRAFARVVEDAGIGDSIGTYIVHRCADTI